MVYLRVSMHKPVGLICRELAVMSCFLLLVTATCTLGQDPSLKSQSKLVISSRRADDPLAAPRFGAWGFDTAAEDRSVKPGDDFNVYANGSWIRDTTIPGDRTSIGLFANLRALSDARTKAILEKAAASHALPTAPEGKLGAMYRSFMDVQTVESKGAKPLESDLNRLPAIGSREAMAEWMGHEFSGFQEAPFELDIAYDTARPNRNAVYLDQGGLGLPDRDYYLDPQFAPKKAAYEAYAAQLLELAGWSDAKRKAAAIVSLETQIAAVSWTHADERDATKTNNPTTIAALAKAAPEFPWVRFLRGAGLGNADRIIVRSKTSVPKIAVIYAATSLETLRAWEAFRTIDNAAPYLSSPFVQARFDFRSHILSGQPELPIRWKRAVTTANDAMGAAIGKIYVAEYFSPKAEAQVGDLVTNLRAALRERIDALTWMGPATKAEAQKKLANLQVQIGYPHLWRDYSGLEIRDDDLYGNVARSRAFDWQRRVRDFNKPWDKSAWRFWPQYPTAYTEDGQLIFTAGIAQPPFFEASADSAINYGALGAVIGHELTHSFDDQGRKEDAQGRLRDWWTAEDASRFEERAKRLSAQYSAMEPLAGLHLKGNVTLGENIADLGGLTIALSAYHASLNGKPAPVIDGVTGDQRVFLGWAQVWREKIRPEALRRQIESDLHSPNAERINGVVRNMDSWYKAYDIQEGQMLYLAPDQRVQIW